MEEPEIKMPKKYLRALRSAAVRKKVLELLPIEIRERAKQPPDWDKLLEEFIASSPPIPQPINVIVPSENNQTLNGTRRIDLARTGDDNMFKFVDIVTLGSGEGKIYGYVEWSKFVPGFYHARLIFRREPSKEIPQSNGIKLDQYNNTYITFSLLGSKAEPSELDSFDMLLILKDGDLCTEPYPVKETEGHELSNCTPTIKQRTGPPLPPTATDPFTRKRDRSVSDDCKGLALSRTV